MEEYDFFKELCHVALATDKHVRFAGVMENSGKLLVGEYREDINSPLVNSSSEPEPSSNLFYASYISVTVTLPFASELGQLRYQVSEYENVKLITVPLTVRNDRFLCISLDIAPSCQKTISKVLESI